MLIRTETPRDAGAIHALTTAAFAGAEHSDGTEAAIVDRLRDADALAISLVAEEAGHLLGHVAFSKVTIGGDDLRWYGLGPVSVDPARQGAGIGMSLIREGLTRIVALGGEGCVVLGDPAYYGRFGFETSPGLTLEGVPPEYFTCLSFQDNSPQGAVVYHTAFGG